MLAAQGLYSTNTSYWTIRHPAFGSVGRERWWRGELAHRDRGRGEGHLHGHGLSVRKAFLCNTQMLLSNNVRRAVGSNPYRNSLRLYAYPGVYHHVAATSS